MKIYLASFQEPHNFGPGKLISLAYARPQYINTVGVFEPLAPPVDLIKSYNDLREKNDPSAATSFIAAYKNQLETFASKIKFIAREKKKNTKDLLFFEDGDSLLSWERENFSNFRYLVKPVLEDLGYEVVLH